MSSKVPARPLSGFSTVVQNDAPAGLWAGSLLQQLGSQTEFFSDPGRPDTHLTLGSVWGSRFSLTAGSNTHAEDWAESGAMALTGRDAGPYLTQSSLAASAAKGALAAASILAKAAGLSGKLTIDHRVLGERAAIAGLTRSAPWSVGRSSRIFPAQRGHLAVSLPRQHDIDMLHVLTGTPRARSRPWDGVKEWLTRFPAIEAARKAQELGIPAAALNARSADMAPAFRSMKVLGRKEPATQPVVIDLSAMWAGPLCAHILGLSGCRIIKVESDRRPDGTRLGPKAFFDLLHGGHESLSLDFSNAHDRRFLEHLLTQADIVITSSRPRALRQLGLMSDLVKLSASEPGPSWVAITAYGQTGPWANRVGFGDDVAAGAGLTGTMDDKPIFLGDAIADPLTGAHASVAALAALASAAVTWIDVSMECVSRAVSQSSFGDSEDVLIDPSEPTARLPLKYGPRMGKHKRSLRREFAANG